MAVNSKELWKMWYSVNPCHDVNLNSGKDMFNDSVELVMTNIWEAATKAAEEKLKSPNKQSTPCSHVKDHVAVVEYYKCSECGAVWDTE